MVSLLKSVPAFEERASECGLSADQIQVLKDKGINTLASLAFSLTSPGTTPSDDGLRGLLDSANPGGVNLTSLACIRRLMFESQTLSIAQLKNSIEGNVEKKAELVPAERTARIQAQRNRMLGLELVGSLECSYACYDLVGTLIEADTPLYLEPHRFGSRAQEVSRERPPKQLVIDGSAKLSFKEQQTQDRCALTDPLLLHQALSRRALAFDLMQVCSFSVLDKWHRLLIDKLHQHPPPNFRKVSMEQILRCDRAAWIKLSEQCASIKRDATGTLPLDGLVPGLIHDPHVMFHLLPLHGHDRPSHDTPDDKRRKKGGKGKEQEKEKAKEKGKQASDDKQKGAEENREKQIRARLPKELQDPKLMIAHNGTRLCWSFNLAKGCSFAAAGKECKKGLHKCMKCAGDHALHECKA
jgi:hypothetical protein